MNIDQYRKPITISQSNKMKNHSSSLHHHHQSKSNKYIITKQESIEAIYGATTSSSFDSNDQDITRKRATSKLVNNFTRQNRYTLGVGIRKMSILIDRPVLPFHVSRFQKAVKNVISLLRLVSLLRSRNSQLVKISLMKIMNLVQAPQNAGIMNDVGTCEALIELLDLDPLNHFQIVGMALHGLKLLALSSDCSLKIAFNSHFLHNVDNFLRSNSSSITQRLTAEVICRCFIQPIHLEYLILQNNEILNLFLRCLYLPFRDIQIRVLSVMESLTYHCDNTSIIILKSLEMPNLDIELFQQFIDIITHNTEKMDDYRYHTLMVLRNIFYAMEVDQHLIPVILRNVVNLEHALIKMIRILKGSSRHVGENNSTSNLLITKRDLGHSQETIERPKRKTSVALVRRNSLKYLSEASLEIQSSSTKMSPEEKSLQFENIRKMEEINTIMEILFLIHTSPICQKILKNSKLPSPTINLSTFSSNLIK